MKVKIGPYINRWVSNVHTNYMNKKYGWAEWKDNSNKFEEYLEKLEDTLQGIYNLTINRWLDNKQRKFKIKIDGYDTWSMDHTLAPIILPMLKQLKETKHGSPIVELKDVPVEMRTTHHEDWTQQLVFDFYKEEGSDTEWDMLHKRWEWILDEMIWAFEQLQDDCDWEAQYWEKEPEFDFDKKNLTNGKEYVPVTWKTAGVCDFDGLKAHEDRIENGTMLFGKYYLSLWD